MGTMICNGNLLSYERLYSVKNSRDVKLNVVKCCSIPIGRQNISAGKEGKQAKRALIPLVDSPLTEPSTVAKAKLFWGSGSAFCWRVLIVLEEKKLPYESIIRSFEKGDHKSPEIMALNPRGQFPTFTDGEIIVNESGAICLYLETKYPKSGACLLPSDYSLMAGVYQTMFESSSFYSPFSEIYGYYLSGNGAMSEGDFDIKLAKVKAELSIWEAKLTEKKYLVGDDFTLADVFLFPFLATYVRFGAKLTDAGYPSLARYYSRIANRESVRKTWPPHWKDGPCLKPFLDSL